MTSVGMCMCSKQRYAGEIVVGVEGMLPAARVYLEECGFLMLDLYSIMHGINNIYYSTHVLLYNYSIRELK